jgi:2'-5' RNA ligase
MALLHETVEEAVARLGFKRETRAFSPHLTLGRVRRGTHARQVRELGEIVADAEVGTLGTAPAANIIFFQSVLKPSGAEYTPLATFPLGRPGVPTS